MANALRFRLFMAVLAVTVLTVPVRTTTAPSAVTAYAAATDRDPRPKPDLPELGGAGFAFTDSAFGTPIVRITDANTRPGFPSRSYRTPSASHQSAWSADGRWFYVLSDDGSPVPYAFDPSAVTASRVNPKESGNGGLVIPSYVEPQFSLVTPGRLYIAYAASRRTIGTYDLPDGPARPLLDLDTVVGGLGDTYIGGLASSAGKTEKVLAYFGGASQDLHHYVVVFDAAHPSTRHLLDTQASTLDGAPVPIRLDFALHHAAIDMSGRFVVLYPTGTDLGPPRRAPHEVVWDTDHNTFTAIDATMQPNGHDAQGYGLAVNQDCCTKTPWDAAQWQLRYLALPAMTRDLITDVLRPKEVQLADHPTWHNARPDVMVPFITATYRWGNTDAPWRAWDDEIIAVQTGATKGKAATVWRFAQHRSNVASDVDPAATYFWYMPRPNVSPDGRFVLFTSDWEKTLGRSSAPEKGGGFRQDVFLLRLTPAGS